MTFHKFIVGFALTLAMVGVLTLSTLAFSARDFQFGVAQVAPDTGGLVSFADLERAHAQVEALEAETADPRGRLLDLERQLQALDARAQAAASDAAEARIAIVGAVAEVEARAGAQAAQSAAADTSAAALAQRVAALAGLPNLAPADQQTIVSLDAQLDALRRQEQAMQVDEAERTRLLSERAQLDGELAESDRRIYALQAGVAPGRAHFDRLVAEVEALKTLSPWGLSAYLAQGHPALLSTMLVVLMGALGSLLYLFPAYLNRPTPVTFSEMAIRLVFGMCAALGLYVLANAAIAGFSMGSAVADATTSAMLNPFTVSLVGIVAGVMSEDIAAWIQERGRGVFQQGGVRSGAQSGAAPGAAPTGGLVNNQAIS